MSEPQSTPLTPGEVSLLESAVAVWADRHPLADYPAFAFAGGEPFSPRQLAEALHFREGEIAERFLRMTQFALEVEPLESIVESFYRAREIGIIFP